MRLLEADDSIVVAPWPADVESAVDVVVHLGSGDHDARARRRENVTEGVDKSLAEAIARDANHLVFVSSAMVYGAWANNPIPLTEDAILRPDVEFVYARQLAAAEAMSDRWRRQRLGRTVTVLRPVVTMATDGTSHLARSLAAGLGQRFGEEDPPAQFLHLDDLASAVVHRRQAAPRRRVQRCARRLDRRRAGTRAHRRSSPAAAARAGRRGARRPAVAVPARPDPARPPQLHACAVARGQRPPEGAGVGPSVTNEQAYVEGTEGRWWTMISPKRRQEIALGGMVAGSFVHRRRRGRRRSAGGVGRRP